MNTMFAKLLTSQILANPPKDENSKDLCGRIPLPGESLANHTFDGFGSKAFVPVDDNAEESKDMAQFFPDDEEDDFNKE